MADNPQTNPSAGPSSLDDKTAQRQVLGYLKDKLRLEGDHRDLLRDSLREMRNSVRELERMTSRIETANRSTINLRELNKEVVRTNQANYLAVQKLSEITKVFGINQNNLTEALKDYNKLVDDKVQKEQTYKKVIQDQKSVSDSLIKQQEQSGKNLIKEADEKAEAIERQKTINEELAQSRIALDEKILDINKEISFYRNKIKEDEIKGFSEIEKIEAKQRAASKDRAELDVQILKNQVQQKSLKLEIDDLENKAIKALENNNTSAYNTLLKEIDLRKEKIQISEKNEIKLSQEIKDNAILNDQLKQQSDQLYKQQDEIRKGSELQIDLLKDQRAEARKNHDDKVKDLSDELSAVQQLANTQLTADQESYINNKRNIDLAEEALAVSEDSVKAATQNLNEGELAYVALQKQLELYKKQMDVLKEKQALEKEVAKNIGISGALAKTLADKLGVGTEVYEAMTLKARELAENDRKRKYLQDQLIEAQKSGSKAQIEAIEKEMAATEKQQSLIGRRFSVLKSGFGAVGKSISTTLQDPVLLLGAIGGAFSLAQKGFNALGGAISGAGNMLAGFSKHSSNVVRNLTSGITGLIDKIPIVGGLLSGLINGLAAFADLVLGQEDYIIKLGRAVGISAEEATKLYDNYTNLNLSARESLMLNQLNTEQYYESRMQLYKNLGVNSGITDSMVEQNVILQKRLGITEQETTELLKNQAITGKTANEQVAAVLGQVKSLKDATGVAINYKDVIKSVTSLSGVLGLQFAKYPEKITRAVISTKALGMELSKLDSTADSFLDFESSISKEFEAQLLTGKDINLNTARQLALNNDLAGLAEEITHQLGDSDSFLRMNRIQQEAIASALGMSRNELGDILKQQVLYSKLGAKDEESYKNRVKYFRDMAKTQEGMAQAMRETRLGEADLVKMFDQSGLENFEDMINKIKIAFVDFARSTGFVDKIKEFLNYLSEPGKMQEFLRDMRDTFAKVASYISEIVYQIVNAIDYIPGVKIPQKLLNDLKFSSDTIEDRVSNTGKLTKVEFDQAKQAETIKQKEPGGAFFDYNKETKKFGNIVQIQKDIIAYDKWEEKRNKEENPEVSVYNERYKNVGGIPGALHADGGIFTKATTLLDPKTNISHTFGEAGPEILIPLDQLGDMLSNTVAKIESTKVSRAPNVIMENSQNRQRSVNENYKFDLSVNVEGREIARATRDVIRNAVDLKFDASTGVLGSA